MADLNDIQSCLTVDSFGRAVRECFSPHVYPAFSHVNLTDVYRPYVYSWHQHLNYELIFLERGTYHCRVNDSRLTLQPDELLIVKPGDWHEDYLEPPCRYLALLFTLHFAAEPDGCAQFIAPGTAPETLCLTTPGGEFRRLVERVAELESEHDPWAANLQDALVTEFFWRLVRLLPRAALAERFVELTSAGAFAVRLYRQFQENVTRQLAVGELSARLNMSPSALAQACKKLLGLTPARAFARYRLERAKLLLESTDMSVKEVAAHLGFENQYHFSRVFKRVFGRAPTHSAGGD